MAKLLPLLPCVFNERVNTAPLKCEASSVDVEANATGSNANPAQRICSIGDIMFLIMIILLAFLQSLVPDGWASYLSLIGPLGLTFQVYGFATPQSLDLAPIGAAIWSLGRNSG